MRITSCVPLAGPGLIARYGALVAVTDGGRPAPDLLLNVLAEVAAAAGDGSELVLRAARAALDSGRQAAWACAGVMADGGVALLVHGRAVAAVGVEGAPEVTLTPGDSRLPVSRTFTGATVTLGLAVGETAPPDPSFWLGEGVVPGGGLAVTVTAGTLAPVGVLVLDDGTRFPLDGDYVLGREPALDGDVLAGRARPLRINDPNGTVSRLHLKISLVGWQVEVSDLGSANGSVLYSPDGERALTPFEPTLIEPGARIGIGHRSMQYLAYQGVLP
jgi:hypothetical protein